MSRESRALVELLQESLDRVLNSARRYPLPAIAEKECCAVRRLSHSPQQLVTLRLVVPERKLRVVTDRDDPLFPSLATHFHLLRQEIDVHPVDAAQLGQSHPRRVKQLEDRGIPHVGEFSFPCFQLRRLKQQLYLRAIEIARQIFVLLGRIHTSRRIHVYLLAPMQVLVEAPHRRQTASDRALVQLLAREMSEKAADRKSIKSLPRPLANSVVLAKELDELVQIAAIGGQSMRGYVALFLQMHEKVCDFA